MTLRPKCQLEVMMWKCPARRAHAQQTEGTL